MTIFGNLHNLKRYMDKICENLLVPAITLRKLYAELI